MWNKVARNENEGITQVLSMGLFISLYKEKRKPTIEWFCPFWTGGNRCGLAVPGEDKAPHRCPPCRWSSVSRFPLQAWQAIGSRRSFKKHIKHVATQMKPQTCFSKIRI